VSTLDIWRSFPLSFATSLCGAMIAVSAHHPRVSTFCPERSNEQ